MLTTLRFPGRGRRRSPGGLPSDGEHTSGVLVLPLESQLSIASAVFQLIQDEEISSVFEEDISGEEGKG